jgi:hypothetical protein
MIRKMIIVVMTLGAVVSLGAQVGSLRWTLLCGSRSGMFGLAGGRFMFMGTNASPGSDGGWCDFNALPPGFPYGWKPFVIRSEGRMGFVSVPLWLPFVLFSAYPLFVFIRHGPIRRSRRRQAGLCVKCGYDLTGNVTGTCPECGSQKTPRNGC